MPLTFLALSNSPLILMNGQRTYTQLSNTANSIPKDVASRFQSLIISCQPDALASEHSVANRGRLKSWYGANHLSRWRSTSWVHPVQSLPAARRDWFIPPIFLFSTPSFRCATSYNVIRLWYIYLQLRPTRDYYGVYIMIYKNMNYMFSHPQIWHE